ncbi:hypothetical protein BKA80DRAFT_28395 [Phyllosticta citrichinensis]
MKAKAISPMNDARLHDISGRLHLRSPQNHVDSSRRPSFTANNAQPSANRDNLSNRGPPTNASSSSNPHPRIIVNTHDSQTQAFTRGWPPPTNSQARVLSSAPSPNQPHTLPPLHEREQLQTSDPDLGPAASSTQTRLWPRLGTLHGPAASCLVLVVDRRTELPIQGGVPGMPTYRPTRLGWLGAGCGVRHLGSVCVRIAEVVGLG